MRADAYMAGRLIERLKKIEEPQPRGHIGLPYWQVAEMQLEAGQASWARDTAERGLRHAQGLGTDQPELEDVICPMGWEIVAEGDRVVCERCVPGSDPKVCEHLPPAYKPSSKGTVEKPIGILGWSIIAAASMWVASILLKRKRR